MYIIRLDDASEYSDVKKWNKMQLLLDKFQIKPIVGIIPNNNDESLISKYSKNDNFWDLALEWQKNGWIIALHGFSHKYITEVGGINPVQNRSEFAGVDLKNQKKKIFCGVKILKEKGLFPQVFFAPSHTFDSNTLIALKECSNIRIISDTIANDIYYKDDIFFIPQQSGRVRKLPFKVVTFCYHPNEMTDDDFNELENFINENRSKFTNVSLPLNKKRKKSIFDCLLEKIYFFKRKI